MPIQRCRYRVESTQAGLRLDRVVHSWLEAALARALSKSSVRRLIIAGAIRMDGRPMTRPASLVVEGARLEAAIDLGALPPAGSRDAAPHGLQVLFEDEALIAVNKPAGLQVHASADPSRPDLFAVVLRYLADPAGSPGGRPETCAAPGALPQAGRLSHAGRPYLALHHRLDRETSGVVLFVKAPEANAGVAEQFEGHRIEKVYHAITARPARLPVSPWVVENSLGSLGTGRRARTGRVLEGGERALTRFSVLERLHATLLVEARPETGRKHQIRAHLAEGGMAILGDARYGGRLRIEGRDVPRAMLHAARLALSHPLTREPLQISAPYPEDFETLLAGLRPALA